MLRFDLFKDNVNYIILKSKKYLDKENEDELKVKGSNYKKLSDALLERISDKQKDKITKKNNIIFFDDLTSCFTKIFNAENDDGTECICGVHIDRTYKILNTELHQDHIIGSVCIKNWKFTNEEKRLMKKEDVDKLCYFCNKRNIKIKCRKCPEKLLCKSTFDEWRTNVQKQKTLKRLVIKKSKI